MAYQQFCRVPYHKFNSTACHKIPQATKNHGCCLQLAPGWTPSTKRERSPEVDARRLLDISMELVDAADCAGTQTWPKSTRGSPVSLSSELSSVNTCHWRLCVCCGIYCSWAYNGPSTCDEWPKGSSDTLCQLLSPAGSMASWSTGMYRRTEASTSSGSLVSLLSTSDSMSGEGALLPCRREAARRWRQHRCTIKQNTFKLEYSTRKLT